MELVKYRGGDPWRTLDTLRDEINSLFEGTRQIFPWSREDISAPSVDVWEDDKTVYVEADLPGFEQKDIDLKLGDDNLTLSAKRESVKEEKEKNYYRSERRRGTVYRQIELPSSVDNSKLKARFKDGVLHVSLPKREEDRQREIKVNID
jgi:HSP20 family protein